MLFRLKPSKISRKKLRTIIKKLKSNEKLFNDEIEIVEVICKDEKEKTFYCRSLKAHFGCYVEAKIPQEQKQLKKCVVKLRWRFEDVKEIVEDYYKKREVSLLSSHD